MAAPAAIAPTDSSSTTKGCSIMLLRLSRSELLRPFPALVFADLTGTRSRPACWDFFFLPVLGFLFWAMLILSRLIEHAHVGVFEGNCKRACLFPVVVEPAPDIRRPQHDGHCLGMDRTDRLVRGAGEEGHERSAFAWPPDAGEGRPEETT